MEQHRAASGKRKKKSLEFRFCGQQVLLLKKLCHAIRIYLKVEHPNAFSGVQPFSYKPSWKMGWRTSLSQMMKIVGEGAGRSLLNGIARTVCVG